MEFTRILRLHGLRPKNERRISMKKHPLLRTALLVMTAAALLCVSALAVEDGAPANSMYGTFWALVPPVIAITLALITKEAYSSLFIGVTVGALFSQGFSPIGALNMIVNDGLVAAIKDNAGIFLFLVLLGIIVALVNGAGGSAAFGRWASKNIKTKVGASLATFLLGILIFIDDYFNCLTVGTVMRPVTDSHRISRPKLAYLIDATAAPVCMIAPISSWAAAVSSTAEGLDTGISGIQLFIKAIPYNLYSLLTFVFIIALSFMQFDYGPMRAYERKARETGDLSALENAEDEAVNPKGKVIDLLLPVLVLIAVCTTGMIYVGGFFCVDAWGGTDCAGDFIGAFGNTDAFMGLPWGGIIALLFTVIYLVARRVITFKDAMACIPKGFNAMISPILILCFAWTLCGLCRDNGLMVGDFVGGIMEGTGSLAKFLPAVIFIVACFIGFATGTSWGTIGIMVPLVCAVFDWYDQSTLLSIGLAASCAGGVCGDHLSPISDTTIMASAGAHCFHLNHVATQIPYGVTVAAVSFVSFIIAGLVQNVVVCMIIAVALMIGTLLVIRAIVAKKHTGIFQEMANAGKAMAK